ncbi:MAG: tetratricopeptide repeat protein [Acidobacteriota bacterium]
MATGGYSASDISKLLGITSARLRLFVAEGFVTPRSGPRGTQRFSFQDLVVLRAAQGLLAGKLPARRVHEALRRLREQLPNGRTLAQMRITADSGRVVVRDGAETWEPASGQQVFDFDVAALAQKAAPIARRGAAEARRHEQELDAEDWFELGLDLEATAPVDAEDAYRRALALEGAHYDARLNLGRLRHEAGDLRAAESHYRSAAALHPSDPTPNFNLGVALEDRKRYEEAIVAYQSAITADPSFADAYFNLSGVYEKLGRGTSALRHLKTYRQLVRGPR